MKMEDKSSVDIIRELARLTSREVEIKEIKYNLAGFRTFPKYKKLVYMPYNSSRNNFFVWQSDPHARIGYPTIFSGVFIPLSSRIKSRLNIRNRNILDKLNFSAKSKSNKIGSEYFDSKTVINGNIDSAERRLLSQPRIQDNIIKALGLAKYMTISINEYNVDFVPELKGSSYLSIINPQGWELERDSIEEMFRRMEKIRKTILNE
jgi:hypothetical protein